MGISQLAALLGGLLRESAAVYNTGHWHHYLYAALPLPPLAPYPPKTR